MSVAQLTWAQVCSPTKGPARGVLVALADHANDEDVAWPANSTLVVWSGYSERTVRDALRSLEAAGVITALPEYVRAIKKVGAWTTPYRLHLELCRWHGQPPLDVAWANKCAHRGRGAPAAPPGRSRREGGQEPPVGGAALAPDPPEIPHRSIGQLGSPTPERARALERGRPADLAVVGLLRAGLSGQLTQGPIPGDTPMFDAPERTTPDA